MCITSSLPEFTEPSPAYLVKPCTPISFFLIFFNLNIPIVILLVGISFSYMIQNYIYKGNQTNQKKEKKKEEEEEKKKVAGELVVVGIHIYIYMSNASTEESEGGYSHVSLPLDLIETLENSNVWDEEWSWPWTFDEEEMWWVGVLGDFVGVELGEIASTCMKMK